MLISLVKTSTGKPSNVVIRGVSPTGLALRPHVKLVAGRMFAPGSSEIIVGSAIAKGFSGTQLGDSLHFAQRDWTIVGIFDAGGSGFDSEIWGDVDQLMQSFRRTSYSSMVLRIPSADGFARFKADIDVDPRLTDEAKREQTFYGDQSKALSTFINILGITLSTIFSIAAMIGAMITMYASVANRVAEIGTLRARSASSARTCSPRSCWKRCCSASSAVSRGRVRVADAVRVVLDDQLSNLRRPVVSLRADARDRREDAAVLAGDGAVGGFLPAMRAARLKIVDALRA